MHSVRRYCKCRNPGFFFQYLCQCRKIGSIHIRNWGSCKGNKFRMQLPCCLFDIIQKFFIISHDRINFCQTGNIDQTVLIVPADLIVSVVGRIASGRVVHDCHAAKLIKCRTHTGYIRCINWYDSIRLSHIQLSHPHPFRTTRSSVSFSSVNASAISSAVLRIPSNP